MDTSRNMLNVGELYKLDLHIYFSSIDIFYLGQFIAGKDPRDNYYEVNEMMVTSDQYFLGPKYFMYLGPGKIDAKVLSSSLFDYYPGHIFLYEAQKLFIRNFDMVCFKIIPIH